MTDIVVIDYLDLVKGIDMAQHVSRAYDIGGLGILLVRNGIEIIVDDKFISKFANSQFSLPSSL
jgi:hypothetical protein